jgi:deoxyxylulose-5-phosphate synthase
MGLPDHHVEQGESGEVLAALGLDAQGIVNAVRAHQARLALLHDKFQ